MKNIKEHRFLLEFHSINEDGLNRVETLIWLDTEALCWLLHDKDTWNALVLVLPKKERPIERRHFNRAAVVDVMKSEGFGDFAKINAHRIDKTLENFIKRPGVKLLKYTPEAQEYFDRVKPP